MQQTRRAWWCSSNWQSIQRSGDHFFERSCWLRALVRKAESVRADHNQLIVGPESWAYQVLRQTLGERFMVKIKVTIFIDRSFIFNSTFVRTEWSQNDRDWSRPLRVSVLFTDVAKADFVFELFCDVEMIINHSWTSETRETSCKKLLDKYNADPLFVREVSAVTSWRIDYYSRRIDFHLARYRQQPQRPTSPRPAFRRCDTQGHCQTILNLDCWRSMADFPGPTPEAHREQLSHTGVKRTEGWRLWLWCRKGFLFSKIILLHYFCWRRTWR